MNLRVWIRNWLLKPAKGERNTFYIGGARPSAKYSVRRAQVDELIRDELPEASIKSMITLAMDHKELIREALVDSDQGQPNRARYREDAGHIPPPSASQVRREEGTP